MLPRPHTSKSWLKTMSLNAAILCFVASASCQTITTKPSGAEKFYGLKDKTIQATQSISSYRAKDVYEEITTLLTQFDELYKKVQQSKNTDAIISEIEVVITNIASSYRKLSGMEVDISQVFNKEMASLKSTHGQTADIVASVNGEIANYQKAITALENALQWEGNPIEKQKKEITIRGHKSIIASLEGRRVIWSKFTDYQDGILKKLGTNRDNIGLLFHTLKTNADVYEQAAETIRLRRIAVDSLGNLLGLSDIDGLIVNIQNTWIAVDDIVAKIAASEFAPEERAARPGM